MSDVKYEVRIGDYGSDVYVRIELSVKNGLSKTDYETVRTAMQTIEDIANRYKEFVEEVKRTAEAQ